LEKGETFTTGTWDGKGRRKVTGAKGGEIGTKKKTLVKGKRCKPDGKIESALLGGKPKKKN